MAATRQARRRPPARTRRARPRARPRARKPSAAWRAHAPDALGLAVLFGAILMCLSLARSAGPVGVGVNWALRAVFGSASYVVPVGSLLVALAAFVRRSEVGRILVGASLLVASIAGFAHLLAHTPALTAGWEPLARGG